MKFLRRRHESAPASPRTIDAVVVSPDGVVNLLMGYAVSMPIDAIQNRVQDYVSFAIDGQMIRNFPETAGRAVQILIAPDDSPTAALESYVELVRPRLASHRVGVAIARRTPETG